MKKIATIFSIALVVLCALAYALKPEDGQMLPEKKVRIETSMGTIVITLYNETPQHRDNFLKLVKEGVYEGTLFHRVIPQFMIQGGDPDSKDAKPGDMLGVGNVGYTVPAEFNKDLIHKRGALAAARQADQVNPTKASSGCQFYLVQGKVFSDADWESFAKKTNKVYSQEQATLYKTIGGTPFLDDNYTVFGEVVKGLEVLDKIANVACDRRDRPMSDISMKMTIVE